MSRSINTAYQATTDIFVVVGVYCQAGQGLAGYADASNPPSTRRGRMCSVLSPENYGKYSFTMPVRQGEW